MRLLIISSEVLNLQNIITSTFELSQAQILSEKHEVAILSVEMRSSLGYQIKVLAKRLLMGKKDGQESLRKITRQFIRDSFNFIFRKTNTCKYSIEGIEVFEGIGALRMGVDVFERNVKEWTRVGLKAFNKYYKEKGLPEILHAHGRFLNAGVLAHEVKMRYGVKYVYTEHSTYFQTGLAPEQSRVLFEEIIRGSSRYIAVSRTLLNSVNKFLGKNIENALVIPNVVDRLFESPISDLPSNSGTFVYTNVALLDHKKGHDILIKAFSKAFGSSENCILNICGKGPLLNELVELRDSLNLQDRVFFLGSKSKMEVKQLLDQSTAFVLSSRVETFGVVVIEALVRGLPVIATRSGGPENIVTCDCGLLVEPDNVEDLALALSQMTKDILKFDRPSIRRYGLEHYGSANFLVTMDNLYKSVLQ